MNRFCAWLVNFHYNCQTQSKPQCTAGYGKKSSVRESSTCLVSSRQPVHVHQLALIIQHQLGVRQHVGRQRRRGQERVLVHRLPELNQRLEDEKINSC